ncbi:uncharacterized protein LOC122319672 [Drosophila yakuba]|uniref:uncharacterized protein LOC122319672 n=1 Tax=Drosophila yakuba TaxID=7245 RepID=UPI001C893AFB|nr:uncharacterized protein LOC122319672 [Drosophila yakuba]
MVRLIRSKYWIPRIKNLMKAVKNPSKVCVIHKKRLQSQLMGVLPKERASFSRPFTYTGMDYAGPFDIKNYTGRACLITKGFVLVFVCFSTKAYISLSRPKSFLPLSLVLYPEEGVHVKSRQTMAKPLLALPPCFPAISFKP